MRPESEVNREIEESDEIDALLSKNKHQSNYQSVEKNKQFYNDSEDQNNDQDMTNSYYKNQSSNKKSSQKGPNSHKKKRQDDDDDFDFMS